MKPLSKTTWINILILGGFTIWFLLKSNYEFLLYTFTIGILIWIIEKTDKIFHYPLLAKYGFNVWLFLHFSGGTFYFKGQRLYDLILLPLIGEPYNLLRYDQLIHAFCYIVITLFIYAIVMSIVDKKANRFVVYLIIVLAGSSIGAVNEIIEFITVILFDAGDAVGGYYNTALDLVFNFIGALIAVCIAIRFPNHSNQK